MTMRASDEQRDNNLLALVVAVISGISVYLYLTGGQKKQWVDELVGKYGTTLMPLVGGVLGSLGQQTRSEAMKTI